MEIPVRYYLITVMLADKSVHSGVRANEHNDVDQMFLLCRNKAFESYGQRNVIYFQCVQLSNHSDEVKDYLIKQSSNPAARKKGYYK